MPEAVSREILARGRSWRCRHIPAKRSCRIRDGLPRGEFLHRRTRDDSVMRVDPTVEHHLRKGGHIARGREQSRVARNSSEGPSILVVYFAHQQAFAKLRIIFR